MKVKIVRCSEPRGWYASHVGKIFELSYYKATELDGIGLGYRVKRDTRGNIGCILAKDAVIYTPELEKEDRKRKNKVKKIFAIIVLAIVSTVIASSLTIKED